MEYEWTIFTASLYGWRGIAVIVQIGKQSLFTLS